MKVNIPFVYWVHYKKPRQPSWSHSEIASEATFDIEDVAAADAPVVHVVSDDSMSDGEDSYWGGGRNPKTVSKFHVPGGDCVIRKHAGQYYASRFPVAEIATWRDNPEYDPFAVKMSLRGDEAEHGRELDTAFHGRKRSVSLEDFHAKEGDVKKFTSDRATTDRYFNHLVGQFAVIDGVLYEKVDEPVVSLVVQSGGKLSAYIEEVSSPVLTHFRKGDWRGNANERIRFGLDEFDRAMKVAARIAVANKLTLAIHANVSQVSAAEVRFRGDHEYLFSAASGVASQLTKAVAYMPEKVGLAVLGAANLLAIHDRMTPAALQAVRKMEAELRVYFAGDHSAPPSDDYHYDYDLRQAFGSGWRWKLDRLTDAISHWDARDDVGLEWFDDALDALPIYDYPKRAYELTSQLDIDKVATMWKGGMPHELEYFDPGASVLVVVEDFEDHVPYAALIYDRSDLTLAPQVVKNGDHPESETAEVLANAFVQSAKADVGHSLSVVPARRAFRP
ncbi:hypothetical protein [Rhizobium sp. BK176]|uniref:hypothetical protein n=1 Tax=Rhizobium sp. BK176 TaxID=2587071 RepID=UPI0021698A74|nr:hypothetical protein [Rhizobium sp. BK176]MCS4088891.1 hypothetical protein [Rhizobium sp. BK176]